MRQGFEQMPVLKRAGLMLSGIADEVVFFDPMVQDLIPLDAGGKPRPATTAQSRLLELIDYLSGLQFFDTPLPGLIPADLEVSINFPRRSLKRLDEARFCRSRHSLFRNR